MCAAHTNMHIDGACTFHTVSQTYKVYTLHCTLSHLYIYTQNPSHCVSVNGVHCHQQFSVESLVMLCWVGDLQDVTSWCESSYMYTLITCTVFTVGMHSLSIT